MRSGCMTRFSQIESAFRNVEGKVANVVNTAEQKLNQFADEYDHNVTISRIFTVINNLFTGVSDETYWDSQPIIAAPLLGGTITLAVLGIIVKQVQADDQNEINHPYHLLLSMMREANRIADRMFKEYKVDCANAMKQQFFEDLGFKHLNINNFDEEFHELASFLYLANPGVSRVRRLARQALAERFFTKKTLTKLEKSRHRFEDYIYGETITADEGSSSNPRRKNNGLLALVNTDQKHSHAPTMKGKEIIINDDDFEEDSDERAGLLKEPPKSSPILAPVKLNAWERFVTRFFFTSGDLHDLGMESEAPTTFLGKSYLKFKNLISHIWVETTNYSLYYWVAWAAVWLIMPAAIATATATTLGSALTLFIPMAPSLLFFVTKPFRSKSVDEKTAAQSAAEKTAYEISFAKTHVRKLRYAYEKLHGQRMDALHKFYGVNTENTERDEDESTSTHSMDLSIAHVKKILNKKHANWKEVKKHLISLRFFDAFKLSGKLAIKRFSKNYNVDAEYKSPTQLVLERLQAKHRTKHNTALSVVTNTLSGGLMASFASWPITSILVFAGVSAAGGPIAGLVCYGIAAFIGVYFGAINGTKANIKAKQEKARIEQLAGAANELIKAEKETEALRIKLKNRYEKAKAEYGENNLIVKLLKPVLSKKDLVTDTNMNKNKTTQGTSLLKKFERVTSRVMQGVIQAQSGILISRFLVYGGGVFAILSQLGVIGSLGTTLPITILVSCALMYSGIKLHEYCRKIQERKDFKVLEEAGAKLEVVNENKAFLEQQLADQEHFRKLLKQSANDSAAISLVKGARMAQSVSLIKAMNTGCKAKNDSQTGAKTTRVDDSNEYTSELSTSFRSEREHSVSSQPSLAEAGFYGKNGNGSGTCSSLVSKDSLRSKVNNGFIARGISVGA